MRGEARRVAGLYEEKLKKFGKVINPGFFEYEDEAHKAASALKREEVDVIVFIELAYQKGLIPMRALLQFDVPIIIWNSQLVDEFGEDADFDLIMVNSGMAGLPEATSSLIRAKRRFWVVTGSINDDAALQEMKEYLRAARAVSRLKNSRIGIIGHPYEGMTDLMQDNFTIMEQFGCSSLPIDHDEIIDAFLNTTEKEGRRLIDQEKQRGRKIEVDEEMMLRSARLALALEKVVKRYSLDAVAEFDQVWLSDERVGIIPFYGTSRMVENHVPFTCEADVLRAMAMLVLEEVAGHATFLEHYILDYKRDQMFNSHDGHGNPGLANPNHDVRIVPTIYYKGVHGFGASFNYSYRPGDFTLFSIGNIGDGKFQFISSEGRNLEMKPRDIAAPQTFFKWGGGSIKNFSEEWLYAAPSHHHTGAYGKRNSALSKVADMLGVECVII
jgi:L-arabinose isomerase